MRTEMNRPPRRSDTQGGLLRLRCPHCQAEYPLWFRSDEAGDDTLSGTEWELWLTTKCRECGKTPDTAKD